MLPPAPTIVPESSGDTQPEFDDVPFQVERDRSDPTPRALARDLSLELGKGEEHVERQPAH